MSRLPVILETRRDQQNDVSALLHRYLDREKTGRDRSG